MASEGKAEPKSDSRKCRNKEQGRERRWMESELLDKVLERTIMQGERGRMNDVRKHKVDSKVMEHQGQISFVFCKLRIFGFEMTNIR